MDNLLYYPEWQQMLHLNPTRFRFDFALSREQVNTNGDKKYIQDKVLEHGDELFEKMTHGAHLYLCGLKGMMPGILTMLESVATRRGLVWSEVLQQWKHQEQWHVEVY